ncbi:hypothetical protein M5X06_12705 [Paenibacillus alvei]|uniref:Phage protein n=1 Tax=Paenibacillus alvei TaxID=44250 RepID=A0ABT4GUL0_PAEAL|nr:hypothetical protein [Paenibacillus alvei]MCY9760380.1 hypothetical protein [Paenibacillus alvei]MCY9767672.1 hypothetical protein [Paenibacillus alvei]
MDKEKAICELKDAIETLGRKIERLNDGDIGFSEAGDWLHNWGGSIVSAMESALTFIEEAV